ncbi:MAG: tail fiber domain-containing protein [Prolixibacteraceae bacterium]|nr:tail fiber domain-containing protein [Prolixibacteraceae bacterium]
MKKVVLNVINVFLVVVISCVQIKAQEIDVNDIRVKLSNGSGTAYLNSGGELMYKQYSGDMWSIGISSYTENYRGVAYRAVFNDNGSWSSSFVVYGDGLVQVNGVTINSDSTLKEGITTMDNQMDKLKKINGVTYHLKRDKANGGKKKKTHYGFLAQDLEKIYPDMIFTDEKGVKSIFYTELIPVLLEAVKAQQAEIESQNKQLLAIEKRLAKLELKKSK